MWGKKKKLSFLCKQTEKHIGSSVRRDAYKKSQRTVHVPWFHSRGVFVFKAFAKKNNWKFCLIKNLFPCQVCRVGVLRQSDSDFQAMSRIIYIQLNSPTRLLNRDFYLQRGQMTLSQAYSSKEECNVRSKIWWFTLSCNSHYISRFAAFFIVTRTKTSVVKSDFLFFVFSQKGLLVRDSGESWKQAKILEERGFIGCFFCI